MYSCVNNNHDFINYLLHTINRLSFNMPPTLIIAPTLSSNLSCVPCDSNSLSSAGQGEVKNKAFIADRGKEFSVSSQLNADSGSSGTYIAVRDTNNITDLQMCTPASGIGVMVANGHTIFQCTRVHWRCRPGICYRCRFFRTSRRHYCLSATWQT